MKTADLILYGVGGFLAYKYLWPQVQPLLAGTSGGSSSGSGSGSSSGSSASGSSGSLPGSGPITATQAQQIALQAGTVIFRQDIGAQATAVLGIATQTANGWHIVVQSNIPNSAAAIEQVTVDVDPTGHFVAHDTYGNV